VKCLRCPRNGKLTPVRALVDQYTTAFLAGR
jgi:hypothetical protein